MGNHPAGEGHEYSDWGKEAALPRGGRLLAKLPFNPVSINTPLHTLPCHPAFTQPKTVVFAIFVTFEISTKLKKAFITNTAITQYATINTIALRVA